LIPSGEGGKGGGIGVGSNGPKERPSQKMVAK